LALTPFSPLKPKSSLYIRTPETDSPGGGGVRKKGRKEGRKGEKSFFFVFFFCCYLKINLN
jgi:hypothetical protein